MEFPNPKIVRVFFSCNRRMDKQKSFLLEALSKKGLALCELVHHIESGEKKGVDEVVAVYNEVLKYAEPSDAKVVKFAVHAALVQDHYGRAVKLVHKQYEDKASRELEDKLVELFATLKWTHCQALWSQSLPSKYPPSYRPFWIVVCQSLPDILWDLLSVFYL